MITLAQIESDIAAGFADAKAALSYVNEALPVIEAVDPSVASDVQTAINAANKIVPLVSGLLASNDIDQTTHDALQNRLGAVANPTPPAPASQSDGIISSKPAGATGAVAALILFAFLLFGFSAQAQNITVNGVSVPVLSGGLVSTQDIANAEATAAAVEAATNGLSFTNTSLYIGSGYEDGANNAQDSYLGVDWRFYKSFNFSLELGGSAVLNTTGSGLHDADLRFDLLKDISNFQVYGGLLGGRTFDGAVGYYAGLNAGVRYNMTAALSDSTNPILNFLAGSGKVNTYIQTEIDVDTPFSLINGGMTIQKNWRFGIGFAF